MGGKVSFRPTKRLFVETLTRDIGVRDCIFDLMDNSVDSYSRNRSKKKQRIEIELSDERFSIWDNCGGISRSDLEKHVFRPGYTDPHLKHPTIGMYGIGLKRAIFKLGKNILFETDDGKHHCSMELMVDKWVERDKDKADDWYLPLKKDQPSKVGKEGERYTSLIITRLNDETRNVFTSVFINRLREEVGIYYTYFLQEKLSIIINGRPVEPFEIVARIPEGYDPSSMTGSYNGAELRAVCWVEPGTIRRAPRERGKRGWNVFMNRRLIVHDDTSEVTGWTGERSNLPRFHMIYNEFRGVVHVISNDPWLLPLNTEKNGLDVESPVYEEMLRLMVEAAKPVIRHLSRKYDKSRTKVDEAEAKLQDESVLEGKVEELRLEKIPKNSKFRAPGAKRATKPKKNITVSYLEQASRVLALRKVFGVKSNSSVGRKSFDYAFRTLVGEDNDDS